MSIFADFFNVFLNKFNITCQTKQSVWRRPSSTSFFSTSPVPSGPFLQSTFIQVCFIGRESSFLQSKSTDSARSLDSWTRFRNILVNQFYIFKESVKPFKDLRKVLFLSAFSLWNVKFPAMEESSERLPQSSECRVCEEWMKNGWKRRWSAGQELSAQFKRLNKNQKTLQLFSWMLVCSQFEGCWGSKVATLATLHQGFWGDPFSPLCGRQSSVMMNEWSSEVFAATTVILLKGGS